jgi:hypothetical protein
MIDVVDGEWMRRYETDPADDLSGFGFAVVFAVGTLVLASVFIGLRISNWWRDR